MSKKVIDQINLIYIMSPSYSGSTLLTSLLADDPRISTVGELKASALGDVDEYYCSCGSKLKKCDFWLNVTEYMKNHDREFSLENFGTHFRSCSGLVDILLRTLVRGRVVEKIRESLITLLPRARKIYCDIVEQNKAIIDGVCSAEKTRIFLDGSKDPNRLLHLKRSNKWNIKVIFLTRDGRGACNSYMKHVGVSMENAAKEWDIKCTEMENAINYFDDNEHVRVRYEDLCVNGEKEMKRIYKLMDIPFGQTTNDKGPSKHLLGNNMRLVTLETVKLDEKWKSSLTDQELDVFNSVCRAKQKRFGYLN